jgi:hypothetical protein
LTKFWIGLGTIGFLGLTARFWRTRLIGWIACAYLAFLVVSLMFFDHGIVLDPRILMPVGVMTLIGVMTFLTQFMRIVRGRAGAARPAWVRRVAACVLFLAACYLINYLDECAGQTSQMLARYVRRGCGYETLQRSALIAQVAQLPLDTVPVSARPDVMHFLIGRGGLIVPPESSRDHRWADRIRETLRGNKVVFVDAFRISGLPAGGRLKNMKRWFHLEPLARDKDGGLYWVKPRGGQLADSDSTSSREKSMEIAGRGRRMGGKSRAD